MVCLCYHLLPFASYNLLSFSMLIFCFLICFSFIFSFRIDLLRFKAGCGKRRLNLVIDCVAAAIERLVASVCVCVHLSVGALLFEPFDL